MPATRLKIGGTLASDAQLAGWLDDLLNGANGLQFRRAALTTAGQDIFDVAGVWNGAGQVLDGFLLSITDTASAAASRAMRVRVGATDIFNVGKDGTLALLSGITASGGGFVVKTTTGQVMVWNGGQIGFSADATVSQASVIDAGFFRGGPNILEQRNGTAAQTFRLYRSRVDGSNLGYTALTQDATTGFIVDSVNTGSVGAPTNLLDVRGNGVSRLALSASGGLTIGSVLIQSPSIFLNSGSSLIQFASGTLLREAASAVLAVRGASSAGASIELLEQTAPTAGAADTARIYAADDGGGNTVLRTRVNGGGIRSLGMLGPMTLAQLQALSTTDMVVGVTKARVSDGPAPGDYTLTASGWTADAVNQVLDVVSQSATGTALSGACLYGGIRIRSGTPTLTVYDNTSATGTAIHTITTGSATGGPLSNGWYPWASLGGMRANTTGVHVVLSGSGTWDVIVTAA